MSAAVNAPAMMERSAERGRGKKLTVLQRLVAEDAAIEANELKKRRLVLWLLSLAQRSWVCGPSKSAKVRPGRPSAKRSCGLRPEQIC